MNETIGYVVVEYNQASGQPNIPTGADLHDTVADAEEQAEFQRRRTQRVGRRETYMVATVAVAA